MIGRKNVLWHRTLIITYDGACAWMFATYMASGFLRTILSAILSKMGMGSFYVLAANFVIYTPFALCVIFAVLKRKRLPGVKQSFIVFISVAVLFIATWLIHPSYEEYLKRPIFGAVDAVFRPDFGALAAFLLVAVSKNAKQLYRNLYWGAWALSAYCIYQYIVFLRTGYWSVYNYLGELDQQVYSLDFSYSCCLCGSVFLVMYSMKHGVKDLLMCVVSVMLMVMGGARGAVACFVVFVVLYYLRAFLLLPYKKKLLVILGIAFTAGMLYFLTPVILSRLSQVNSRSIQAILAGTFTEDNGRQQIYAIVKEAMKKLPLLGYGPFGDRPFIAPFYYWGYSHNLVYEMILDFGWFFGVLILGILAVRCVRVYIKAEGYDLAVISILIAANAKLFLSASFWAYAQFWMLMAYLFVIVPVKKRKTKRKKIRKRLR